MSPMLYPLPRCVMVNETTLANTLTSALIVLAPVSKGVICASGMYEYRLPPEVSVTALMGNPNTALATVGYPLSVNVGLVKTTV